MISNRESLNKTTKFLRQMKPIEEYVLIHGDPTYATNRDLSLNTSAR